MESRSLDKITPEIRELLDTPMYGTSEAAHYLRIPYQTLRYWTKGGGRIEPVVNLALYNPPRLSFMNLLECHMLSALRSSYRIRLPKVRTALRTLSKLLPSRHPLVEREFETDSVDMFLRRYGGEIINLSRGGQMEFEQVVSFHLHRIEVSDEGIFKFFPFVEERTAHEPKVIVMTPAIAFGRPVIAGTAIPTSLIASRFHARESVPDLAEEYQVTVKEIEEAIRLEFRSLAA
jgi:uncharacterized protein (DUF433 family)